MELKRRYQEKQKMIKQKINQTVKVSKFLKFFFNYINEGGR